MAKTSTAMEAGPKLADPWSAVDLGDMARREKRIAAAQKRYKSCHRRRQFWKRDLEGVELFVDGHAFSFSIVDS